jgi:uncharacterized protein YbjT (DUF2867 family)
MLIVTGASGQTGSATVNALLERGQRVTAAVHSPEKTAAWKSRGAETAVVDLADAAALTRLLTGKAGAYLMIPPNPTGGDYLEEKSRVASGFAQAVRDSGIANVVLLSSIGAQHPSGTGPIVTLHNAEQRLRPVARNATFLRAPYFLENWIEVLGVAREQGVLPTFFPPGLKFPTIAALDIGRFAADSLVDPTSGVRVLEIAGPEDYSVEELAEILGGVLEKTVRPRFLPLDAAVPTFVGMGLPENLAKIYREMFEAANTGKLVFESAPRRGTVTAEQFFTTVVTKSAVNAAR